LPLKIPHSIKIHNVGKFKALIKILIYYFHISKSQAVLYLEVFIAENMEMNWGLPDLTLMKLKAN